MLGFSLLIIWIRITILPLKKPLIRSFKIFSRGCDRGLQGILRLFYSVITNHKGGIEQYSLTVLF